MVNNESVVMGNNHRYPRRVFFYRIVGKLHQLFLIIVHFMFKIANFGKKEQIPAINNLLLLSSASSLATKIRKKKLKSVDLVQAYISRIKEVNPFINAVAKERFDLALKEAKKIDAMITSGLKTEEQLEKETPFLGVPFTCKELICVKGQPFTVGLLSRKEIRADDDAEAVQLLKKAGAIPIGSTNISELAMWIESYNNVYGRVNNPYDTSRTAGGSSGGEGAIIAAAGSVIGLGSDFGGSIRIPSFFNGIFGHKPTTGIVSSVGMYFGDKKELGGFLSPGPMCRFATDLLPMMKILSGGNSQLHLDLPVKMSSLKVYYMEDAGDYGNLKKVHPDIRKGMTKVLYHLEQAYKIKPQKLDINAMKHGFSIWIAKIKQNGGLSFSKQMADSKGDINCWLEFFLWFFGLSKFTLPAIGLGIFENLWWPKVNSRGHNVSLNKYSDLFRYFQGILGNDGIFLYPTWPEPAPHHYEMVFNPINCTYTSIFNVLGFPVTHCPLGLGREGLPIGIQVVSNLHNDHLCLAVAVELEKMFGGWVSPCAVCA